MRSETTEPEKSHPIIEGFQRSFALPLNQLLDSERHWYHGFSGSISYQYPLDSSVINPQGNPLGGIEGINQNLSATIKYSPIDHWFIQLTAVNYLDNGLQQPWEPDFTYVFGYSDWRPYTFSLVYANFSGNRWSSSTMQKTTNFKHGSWTLGWKFPVAKKLHHWFSLFEDAAMNCQLNYSYTAEYFDLIKSDYLANQQSAQLGCKYTITGNWYVNFNLFYYPKSQQKQPWNPDFTYGLGYFDWRPGTFSLQYNNYSGNRFPGNFGSPTTGRFKDGTLMIAWSWAF